MSCLKADDIRRAVQLALEEDIGSGDVTTLATVPAEAVIRANMTVREPLVLAGIEFAEMAFRLLAPELRVERCAEDGESLRPGAVVLRVNGLARPILSAERVALNFVQRLSGIATMTAQFVKALQGTSAKILDTRKTTPGWRSFEKYAVTCGGGQNHRVGLFDMVLIKDNHLAALAGAQPNPVAAAIQRAREAYPQLKVEVEADTLGQVEQAVAAGADIVLLDNMKLEQLRAAVLLAADRVKTEASGGIDLSTVPAVAQTGVDFISVGALTHSAPAVDIGLDFES